MSKKTLTAAIGVVLPAFCFFGLLLSDGFFQNAALGFIWASSVVVVLGSISFFEDDENEVFRKLHERSKWRKVWSPLSDVFIAVVLAGFGYWWTFGAWILQAIVGLALEQKAEKLHGG